MASHFPILLLILLATSAHLSAVSGSGDHVPADLAWIGSSAAGCDGTIGECLTSADEYDLDSEVSRRILAQQRYISYGSLRRGTTPCSRRGASYYNCRPGAQANPYSRGCSRIARCRS